MEPVSDHFRKNLNDSYKLREKIIPKQVQYRFYYKKVHVCYRQNSMSDLLRTSVVPGQVNNLNNLPQKSGNLKLQDRCQGLQLPMQSVPITTKVVSSNRTCDDVYLIQHYVIVFFVSDLRQVGGILWVI